MLENWPAGHAVQVGAPTVARIEPLAQGVQLAPVLLATAPSGQGTHADAPELLMWFAGQRVHVAPPVASA